MVLGSGIDFDSRIGSEEDGSSSSVSLSLSDPVSFPRSILDKLLSFKTIISLSRDLELSACVPATAKRVRGYCFRLSPRLSRTTSKDRHGHGVEKV